MRMSTKGCFAVNSMIDLALHEPAGPVTLAAIAERQRISLSYLEQIFSRLRKGGLVASTRGPGGGYTLGRAALDISVADVVIAADEMAEAGDGRRRLPELSGALWQETAQLMLRHLATVSLQSLVDEQLRRGFVAEGKPARRVLPPAPPRPLRTTAPNSVFAFGKSFA